MSSIGLRLPVGPNEKGRAATVTGSEFVRQTLLTAIQDCTSKNPFQDLGVDDEIIYDINDESSMADLMLRLQEIFARFEAQEIARLDNRTTPISFSQDEEGEFNAVIRFVDLEADKPEEITLRLPADFA